MSTNTLPPPAQRQTTIHPTSSGRQQLRRRFNLPDESSVTLTLSLSDSPSSYRYRVTHHLPGTRNGTTVFAGVWPASPDPEDTAADVLQALLARPGAPGDEILSSYTPEQLSWVLHHAEAVRGLMATRLGWGESHELTLHAGLEVIAEARAELRASTRYRYRLGVLEVTARTQREAKAALAAAVSAQCSTRPAIRVGPYTRDVYIMYPLGVEYVLQLVHPTAAEPVGTAQRYAAESLALALEILDATVEHREQAPVAPRERPTTRPPARPSARAKRSTLSVHAAAS